MRGMDHDVRKESALAYTSILHPFADTGRSDFITQRGDFATWAWASSRRPNRLRPQDR